MCEFQIHTFGYVKRQAIMLGAFGDCIAFQARLHSALAERMSTAFSFLRTQGSPSAYSEEMPNGQHHSALESDRRHIQILYASIVHLP